MGIFRSQQTQAKEAIYVQALSITLAFLRDIRRRTVHFFKVQSRVDGTAKSATISSYVISRSPRALGVNKIIVPDHKLYMLSLDDENEAHYVCAVLNSRHMRRILGGFLVGKQIGTTIFRYTGIKSYQATDRRHRELATISRRAHRSRANTRNSDDLGAEEQTRLDDLVFAIHK